MENIADSDFSVICARRRIRLRSRTISEHFCSTTLGTYTPCMVWENEN